MADSSIPKDIADSLKSIFTNINTERISEILVGVV
ncbi:mechanosensitive ion channel family protein, partial [Acinetobacter baumannii]